MEFETVHILFIGETKDGISIQIQPDMDRVKLGTGSSCEFRLNPEAFFTGIEMEFRKNGKSWNLECSDDVYFSRGDMRKLLSTEVRHGDVLSVCYA